MATIGKRNEQVKRPAAVGRRPHGDNLGPAARLSILALAGSTAVYVVFAGTAIGRRTDAAILRRDLDWAWEWPARMIATTVRPAPIAVAVVVLCWIALRNGRPADALRAVVLVAASAGLSRLAEKVLEAWNPMGIETARALGPAWYPSGHAAAAMALALAALLVCPARLRSRALLLTTGFAPAMVGWAILADGGHHASDVAGGVLLATSIAAGLAVGRRADLHSPRGLPWRAVAVIVGALVATASVLAVIDSLRIAHSILQPALILAGAVMIAMTLGLVHAFDRALAGQSEVAAERSSGRPPGPPIGERASCRRAAGRHP